MPEVSSDLKHALDVACGLDGGGERGGRECSKAGGSTPTGKGRWREHCLDCCTTAPSDIAGMSSGPVYRWLAARAAMADCCDHQKTPSEPVASSHWTLSDEPMGQLPGTLGAARLESARRRTCRARATRNCGCGRRGRSMVPRGTLNAAPILDPVGSSRTPEHPSSSALSRLVNAHRSRSADDRRFLRALPIHRKTARPSPSGGAALCQEHLDVAGATGDTVISRRRSAGALQRSVRYGFRDGKSRVGTPERFCSAGP